MCTEGEARLVDGNIEQEGRAEVCLKGVWTTICDWGWNYLDAHIMCRTLGYDSSKCESNIKFIEIIIIDAVIITSFVYQLLIFCLTHILVMESFLLQSAVLLVVDGRRTFWTVID